MTSIEDGSDVESSIDSVKSNHQHHPEVRVKSGKDLMRPVGQLGNRPTGVVNKPNWWQTEFTSGIEVTGDHHWTSQRPSGEVTPIKQQQPVGVHPVDIPPRLVGVVLVETVQVTTGQLAQMSRQWGVVL